jgi:hypothetical protein
VLLALWAVCVQAQSLPRIGQMIDTGGKLRQVYGVAGSFVTGAPGRGRVLSAACSDRLCLSKTHSAIESPLGGTPAPPGPALFGLDGASAFVYFPQTRSFARWHDNSLDPLDWNLDGEVLSLRASDGQAEIAVRRQDTVWIVRPDGAVVDAVASPDGPVLLLAGGVLFTSGDKLILRRSDAHQVRLDLAGVEALSILGEHYAQVRTAVAIYALRIDPGRERLYLLKGTPP